MSGRAQPSGGVEEVDANPAELAEASDALLRNPDILNLIQARLNKMVGRPSGFIDDLPKPVRDRIDFLRSLQEKRDDLEEEYNAELRALEAKYEALYTPLYEKRAKIVKGEEEPPADAAAPAPAAAAGEAEAAAAAEPVPKGIPEFWLGVLRTHEVTANVISEKDEAILAYLVDITCEDLAAEPQALKPEKANGEDDEEEEEPHGFTLTFHFAPNPHFKHATLTKTYHMVDDDEEMLQSSEGTDIQWEAGKNPTIKVLKKKAKPVKGKPAGRTLTKTEPCASFFNFFNPPAVPENPNEVNEEEMEDLQHAMEEDCELGEIIRYKLIPRAVAYYTGEAAEDGDEDDEDDYDDEDEVDDEDGDDDDEDDDDEEDDEGGGGAPKRAPQAGKPKAKGKAEAPTDSGEKPPECKQQ
ncbi:hypothetical protein WJX81_003991 [Elliptochloris bilobata]|uniref:Nucleosome assembly protein n=1 Tax=Elliptochloris bilobata TaxID=381761 RepID=A0AAW1S8X4_9CHLO